MSSVSDGRQCLFLLSIERGFVRTPILAGCRRRMLGPFLLRYCLAAAVFARRSLGGRATLAFEQLLRPFDGVTLVIEEASDAT